mgnify:CR=1 FL=1|tara:strand:- start:746 stop:2350 length:1605 start_codon:yes stop_codon:yes gene_type:complete
MNAKKSDRVVDISVAKIDPHPANPGASRITSASVQQLAANLKQHGQQQPIKVRPLSRGRYQLIFGERRWRAAKKLKWPKIQAVVESANDIRVGELQAVENAQREDVDRISVAKHLQQLTGKQDDGSKPLTQAQAGKLYGLSQAEVSNRMRLLKLPAKVQAAVASDALPYKVARELVPFVEAPDLVQKVADQCLDDIKNDEYQAGEWRTEPGEMVHWEISNRTRVLHGNPPADELAKLDVVELPLGDRKKGGKRQPVQVARNVDLYDKLDQEALAAKKTRPATKAQLEEMTPAEKRQAKATKTKRRKELDKQRQARRKELDDEIRRRLVRLAIREQVKAGDWRTHLAALACLEACSDWMADELLQTACRHHSKKKGRGRSRRERWNLNSPGPIVELLATAKADGDEVTTAEEIDGHLVRLALWPASEFADGGRHIRKKIEQPADAPLTVPNYHALDQLAKLWKVTPADGWKLASKAGPARDTVAAFLGYLQKQETADLAKELGVKVAGTTAKQQQAELLKSHQAKKPLKLPKCLK